MDDTISNRAGQYIQQPTGYRAFIPRPLPPASPPLESSGEIQCLLNDAALDLGRLDGLTVNIPNPDLFLSMYVRKEALLSSQIEGTQASLDDVLEYEVLSQHRKQAPEAAEVVRYVAAMNFGLERLQKMPLSLQLIREIHRELMKEGRGSNRMPGEFRTSQNWIGESGCTITTASFVPPPPHDMTIALGELENFIRSMIPIPLLIKCALTHAQFETIHPFLDGNGRVGRLLITFMLCHERAISRPLLYLSYFFKANRGEYYDRLNGVRFRGDWEGWVRFFLRGVSEVAKQATDTARKILDLRQQHQQLIHRAMPRAATNAQRLLDHLYAKPYADANQVISALGVSQPTANQLLAKLEGVGLLKELTKQTWGRVYSYRPYLDLLREGTEQPPPMGAAPAARAQSIRTQG